MHIQQNICIPSSAHAVCRHPMHGGDGVEKLQHPECPPPTTPRKLWLVGHRPKPWHVGTRAGQLFARVLLAQEDAGYISWMPLHYRCSSVDYAVCKDNGVGLHELSLPCVLESQVCLMMDNKLLRANRSIKISSQGLAAFASPCFPALATLGTQIQVRMPCRAVWHWTKERSSSQWFASSAWLCDEGE